MKAIALFGLTATALANNDQHHKSHWAQNNHHNKHHDNKHHENWQPTNWAWAPPVNSWGPYQCEYKALWSHPHARNPEDRFWFDCLNDEKGWYHRDHKGRKTYGACEKVCDKALEHGWFSYDNDEYRWWGNGWAPEGHGDWSRWSPTGPNGNNWYDWAPTWDWQSHDDWYGSKKNSHRYSRYQNRDNWDDYEYYWTDGKRNSGRSHRSRNNRRKYSGKSFGRYHHDDY